MGNHLTAEQRALGAANYQKLVGSQSLTRRDFMKGLAAAGAALPITAAAYFGYRQLTGDPVRTAVIGTGNQAGVLIAEHNPDYLKIVAVCDVRPTCRRRAIEGDTAGTHRGLNRIYGEETTARDVAVYSRLEDVLERRDIQAVIIPLPLPLHAPAAVACLKAGKHVFCEKLMAWNVAQCKEMIRVARDQNRLLSIGHQRHYSLLYAQALEIVRSGELGAVHHIRALWHRNNTVPRLDAQGQPVMEHAVDGRTGVPIPGVIWPVYRDSWRPAIPEQDRAALSADIRALGYRSVEELVRWRLYHRTGGGLMAELGSHQLDACSIFLGKVRPLAVAAVGGKYFFRDDREVEDHIFCTYEFPGENYWSDPARTIVQDKDDVVVVTYSSINTNRLEPYGECVMGNRGTLMVEQEKDVYFFPNEGRSTAVTTSQVSASSPAVDASATWSPAEARSLEQRGQAVLGGAPPSRGYREELEHFAYCVKMWEDRSVAPEDRPRPRCDGMVALDDAVYALAANAAFRGTKANGYQPQRLVFHPDWFNPDHPAVPDPESVVEAVS
ncbi:MAG TPA: Gfo/Idh/MocA family oxidoreductase [Gemmatales bacterium]|nr:Gfo/Idh/MocA family oxidoreductase [Gemmatales bacterium]